MNWEKTINSDFDDLLKYMDFYIQCLSYCHKKPTWIPDFNDWKKNIKNLDGLIDCVSLINNKPFFHNEKGLGVLKYDNVIKYRRFTTFYGHSIYFDSINGNWKFN